LNASRLMRMYAGTGNTCAGSRKNTPRGLRKLAKRLLRFLGLGTHRVAIPVRQFDQVSQKIALQGASKEELKKMPEFKCEA
jgi:hypothetical protein